VKVELCSFRHGKRYARTHGKVFQFLNAKCKLAFLSKRNPWQINCTVLYRRKHKKGQLEEIQKKRTQAITGVSLAAIMTKRNQKPEFRKAQREQHLKSLQWLLLRHLQRQHLSKRL
uniref:Large ribosomal subunit protein eL24 n=1 Tax=Cercocebus atys TaxID=9531 RepID=A0A2K5KJD6_CERAT